jgi:hypothetical protein
MQDSRFFEEQPTNTWAITLKSHDIRGYVFQVEPYSYGHLLNMGIRHVRLMFPKTNWIINIDDDDFYGPDYVQEIKQCSEENPDAVLIGKARFWIERDGQRTLAIAGGCEDSSQEFTRARGLAGPTLSINIETPACDEVYFNEDQGMDSGQDSDFIQRTYECWAISTGHAFPDWAPIYSTSPDNFIYQRYGPEHRHVSKG